MEPAGNPGPILEGEARTELLGAKNAVTASQPYRHWTYV